MRYVKKPELNEDNARLADAFERVCIHAQGDNLSGGRYCINTSHAYRKIAEVIRNYEKSLVDYYNKHKSFEKLNIRGVGPKTMKKLELLMQFDEGEVIGKLRQGGLGFGW